MGINRAPVRPSSNSASRERCGINWRTLDALEPVPLAQDQLDRLENRPGVYELYLNGGLREHRVYVGKANMPLPSRLGEHLRKLSGRINLNIEDIRFKCLYVDEDLDAASPEKLLIKIYRADGTSPWNNSGIGGKDPGHNREDTVVKRKHFDARYPVHPGQVVANLKLGSQSLYPLLKDVKAKLPYLFRFEEKKVRRDHRDTPVPVTSNALAMRDIIRLALEALPEGWQATAMPGRVILYDEIVDYRSANMFWRKQDAVVREFAGEGYLEEGEVDEADEE